MRKQMVNGDRLPRAGTRLDELADRIAHLQLALLLKQKDGHTCELLGDRTEPELRVRRVRDVPFEVGHSVAAAQKDFAALRHKYAAIEPAVVKVSLGLFLESLRRGLGEAQTCSKNEKEDSH